MQHVLAGSTSGNLAWKNLRPVKRMGNSPPRQSLVCATLAQRRFSVNLRAYSMVLLSCILGIDWRCADMQSQCNQGCTNKTAAMLWWRQAPGVVDVNSTIGDTPARPPTSKLATVCARLLSTSVLGVVKVACT